MSCFLLITTTKPNNYIFQILNWLCLIYILRDFGRKLSFHQKCVWRDVYCFANSIKDKSYYSHKGTILSIIRSNIKVTIQQLDQFIKKIEESSLQGWTNFFLGSQFSGHTILLMRLFGDAKNWVFKTKVHFLLRQKYH